VFEKNNARYNALKSAFTVNFKQCSVVQSRLES